MLLLLELNGDLPDHFPEHERRLYIFACPRKACSQKQGSVRAFRATRMFTTTTTMEENNQEPNKKPTRQDDLGASLFGAAGSLLTGSKSNPNPFSSSQPAAFSPQPSNDDEELPESFADKVRISASSSPSPKQPSSPTAAQPWPPKSAFPEPYPQYFLDAEYETLSRPSTPTKNVTVEKPDEGGGGSSSQLKDTFESELDKAFIRFSTRLGHNPEQVLRYEFRGTPLLYSYGDAVGKRLHSKVNSLPPCEWCRGERVFELQLVPHAISVLEEEAKGGDGMEWGTVILGVCSRDCGPEAVGSTVWREEWAGVQWEETR